MVTEEQARIADAAWGNVVHSAIVVHYIATFGTEEQKHRWLPVMASVEPLGAIAMTEPATGSDLLGIRTRARRDGDSCVVSKAQTFISNGTHRELVIIVARTSEETGGRGMPLTVAETTGLAGIKRGRVMEKIGMHGQDTRELAFVDMRVPAGNVLGGVAGLGFVQLMLQLPQERLAIAVRAAAESECVFARQRCSRGIGVP